MGDLVPMKVSSSSQSMFTIIHMPLTIGSPGKIGDDVEAILEIDYYVDEEFNQEIFDSCKYVTMRSDFSPALGLMCGKWGMSMCTPKRWFEFLGTFGLVGFAPFVINYEFFNETNVAPPPYKAYKTEVQPCNEGVNVRVFV